MWNEEKEPVSVLLEEALHLLVIENYKIRYAKERLGLFVRRIFVGRDFRMVETGTVFEARHMKHFAITRHSPSVGYHPQIDLRNS
jgi:hypothetical protein